MAANKVRQPATASASSFSIGRIAGIDIQIHWSWLIIFALLTWSLSEGLYRHDYPNWTFAEGWLAGALTSLALFGCVLIHELSHSLLARSKGMHVSSITLFIFGGVSSLTEEPKRPGEEFAIAAVGPAASFVLAGGFAVLAVLIDGPVGRAVSYLAFINLLLGAFNLLPGFPMDGGRVLRSFVWARSKNLFKATSFASVTGRVLGVVLIVVGFGLFFTSANGFSGLWFAVIGWFLYTQAGMSYQDMVAREVLSRIQVSSLVTRDSHAVRPDISIGSFVSGYVLTHHDRCYPVMEDEELVGLICLSDLRKLPRDDWPDTTVQQSMTPVARLLTVSPSDDLATATALMASGNVHQLPVVEDGRFVGLVTRAEVIQMLRSRDDVARIVGQPEPGSGDSDRAGSAPGDASARHDSKLAASGRTSK